MSHIIKKDNIAIFLVIIAILLGIIFYFTNDAKLVDKNVLEYTVGCNSEKIDASIYSLEGNTSLIGAFITFNQIPISDETRVELKKLGVSLREDSWIFDYVLAKIPTDSLCLLADYDFVKRVFIPTEN